MVRRVVHTAEPSWIGRYSRRHRGLQLRQDLIRRQKLLAGPVGAGGQVDVFLGGQTQESESIAPQYIWTVFLEQLLVLAGHLNTQVCPGPVPGNRAE